MSEETYSFEKSLGVITMWDEYTFGDNDNISEHKHCPRARTKYTVDDLYVLLRKLKQMVDPKNIDRLERMISAHIADKDNPHGVSMEQLVTSVMNELYHDWLDYQNRTQYDGAYTTDDLMQLLSTEQFLKVLYQQISIADVDTALQGTSTYQVTSAKDVHEMVEAHNQDKNAHAALMDYLFPGNVHSYPPSLAVIADVGGTDGLHIVRNGTLSYMGVDGKVHTAAAHTLPVDYSTGRAAYPIFGTTTNHCTHGSVLTASVYTKGEVIVTETTDSVSILESGQTFKVASTSTINTTRHRLSYSIPTSVLAGKSVLCVSIYAKTGTLDNLGINVHGAIENEYHTWHYNLSNATTYCVKTQMPSDIRAELYSLPNGYTRCVYICPIDTAGMTVDIYLLDILDGDLSFKGYTDQYLYLCGLQIETDTDTPSPYKSTTGSTVSELPTTISYSVSSGIPWYNPFAGGIVAEVYGITELSTLRTARYLCDLTMGGQHLSCMSMYYPAVHSGRCSVYYGSASGSMLYSYMFKAPATRGYHRYGVSHIHSGHLQETSETIITDRTHTLYTYGTAGEIGYKEYGGITYDLSTAVDTLYIGCKGPGSLYLNGYLAQLIYYPDLLTPGHLQYFIEG